MEVTHYFNLWNTIITREQEKYPQLIHYSSKEDAFTGADSWFDSFEIPIYWMLSKAVPQVPKGSLGPIIPLFWHPFFPDCPHVLIWVSLALIMLKVCDLLAILFSVHNWKQHLKPTMCPVFINMSFEPSWGIFIVCIMDKGPIILVQIKVVPNRNLFSLLNIMKGPLTFNLRSIVLKKKDKIPQETRKVRKETGGRKGTWQRTLTYL